MHHCTLAAVELLGPRLLRLKRHCLGRQGSRPPSLSVHATDRPAFLSLPSRRGHGDSRRLAQSPARLPPLKTVTCTTLCCPSGHCPGGRRVRAAANCTSCEIRYLLLYLKYPGFVLFQAPQRDKLDACVTRRLGSANVGRCQKMYAMLPPRAEPALEHARKRPMQNAVTCSAGV